MIKRGRKRRKGGPKEAQMERERETRGKAILA